MDTNFQILIIFTIGRIIYSLFGRFNLGFWIFEFLFSVLYLIVSYWILKIDDTILPIVLIVLSYIILSIPQRLIRIEKKKKKKIKIKIINDIKNIGIIDIVWITILGSSLGLILFVVTNFSQILNSDLTTLTSRQLEQHYDYLQFLLSQTINLLIVLGTILAGAMTILWAGEVWRNKLNSDSVKNYKIDIISSARMTFAYFFIAGNVTIWFVIPLFDKLRDIVIIIR